MYMYIHVTKSFVVDKDDVIMLISNTLIMHMYCSLQFHLNLTCSMVSTKRTQALKDVSIVPNPSIVVQFM